MSASGTGGRSRQEAIHELERRLHLHPEGCHWCCPCCHLVERIRQLRGMDTRPAQLLRFSEVLQLRSSNGPVRFVARIAAFDLNSMTAEIMGEDGQRRMRVELPTPLYQQLVLNRLYQWHGDLKPHTDGPVLAARLMRDVEGLDVALWEETLTLRRQFLALD